MRNATKALIVLGGAAALAACGAETEAGNNAVITDINAADPGDIEAVPVDESSVPPPPIPADNAIDNRSSEERGDGDDMVNVIDDTNRN